MTLVVGLKGECEVSTVVKSEVSILVDISNMSSWVDENKQGKEKKRLQG